MSANLSLLLASFVDNGAGIGGDELARKISSFGTSQVYADLGSYKWEESNAGTHFKVAIWPKMGKRPTQLTLDMGECEVNARFKRTGAHFPHVLTSRTLSSGYI